MRWINESGLLGYFGNHTDNLCNPESNTYNPAHFQQLEKKLSQKNHQALRGIFFLKQTHSADVFLLEADVDWHSSFFQNKGDAIITREKNIGIGVVTADCLPIFLHDPKQEAIGVIHAGWRGLSQKIITTVIAKMQHAFHTYPEALIAYLGPAASVCCYEVQPDFLSYFPDKKLQETVIEKRADKLFFNAKKAAILELLQNNVLLDFIQSDNQRCTLCVPGFCSHRKQAERSGRQPSVLLLQAGKVPKRAEYFI